MTRTTLCRRLLIVGLLIGACSDSPPGLSPGQRLDSLPLHSLDGARSSTDEFLGKVVVLNYWATWCAPCRNEMDALQRLADRLGDSRFAVIGVSVDTDLNLVRETTERHGWRFARYIDAGKSSRALLGVETLPRTFILGRDGTVVRVLEGAQQWDTPSLIQSLRDVEARSVAPELGRSTS
jgi:thiol-disulfide isomerase/thioredoxin